MTWGQGEQVEALAAAHEEPRVALEAMVWQFAYDGTKNGRPIISTGGLSALEEAFSALGLDDPHYLTEEEAKRRGVA